MLRRVVEFITRYSMFDRGARVGVAVSGGADSVCLLHILLDLAAEWNLRLMVLHLNHKLRGEESEADKQFVRAMADRLNLPSVVESWHWGEPAGPPNLEEAAREARLAFFSRAMDSGAVERVAVGHTRSDQAETVLFRLLRGAATAGLSGIRPMTPAGIVRPLLNVDRTEVEEFLRARGIPWREDSSNRSPEFARNRIRHGLMPLLAREWNPAITQALANTADWALAEEAYWEAEIARIAPAAMHQSGESVVMETAALRSLPLAAARRLVRHACARVKGDLRSLDFSHIAAILRLAASSEGSGRLQVPGLDVFRSFDWLRFAKPGSETLANRNYRFDLSLPGSVEIPGAGGELRFELIEIKETSERSPCVYYNSSDSLDWSSVSGPLELRNWRPGDQYRPVGRFAEEKIKTLFQEERVPLWERRHWPVLTEGSSILWARRFGPARNCAVHAGTQMVLSIYDSRRGDRFPPAAGSTEERESI